MPPAADLMARDGLRVFTPAAAVIGVAEGFFRSNPIDVQVVLASFEEPSDILRRLLKGGRSVIAGRLAGAFRHVGRPKIAGEILATMAAAGYEVRENDPFADRPPLVSRASVHPIIGRLEALWDAARGRVIDALPRPPGLPKNRAGYLRLVDEIYRSDAYHSLSIEGYSVSVGLIDRVRAGNWNPDQDAADRQSRDALAARGYWQAFQLVRDNISNIIAGADAVEILRTAHRDWYRELFQPCVAAGVISPAALAGYRNIPVYLRTSRYVPPRWETVGDAMRVLFDLLQREPEPGVRAVLGHWMFGYIHPYPDGNGRIARFLMNTMLASGGYPWTVVRMEDRDRYLAALDSASIEHDIGPFADFLGGRIRRTMAQVRRSRVSGGNRPGRQQQND
jgi:hypothetical protein